MTIEYTLSIPEPHTHLLEVEMRIPAAGAPLEVAMPSWTPGSYLLREFPRNVLTVGAHDATGLRLGCRKFDKNRWRIDGPSVGPITLRYTVYANELTVRTSHVDASHAAVNGASVFLYALGMEKAAVRLRVRAPDGWRIATSLHEEEGGTFAAADYDELVDCPLEIGTHRTIVWEQEGVPHRFAIWGRGEVDEARLVADARRIIDVCSRTFGGLPYDRYLFIVHLVPEGRGGLEHRTSTVLQVPAAALSGAEHESLIALMAHEFFHVWLGKRIRPAPLGPFDYTRENYTRNLWVVEGFTTYYTDRILLHAGLITPERYLERLGDLIARARLVPGRHHQSLEDSSFDAWIKFYRPDAGSSNTQVSYYQRGALAALALDLEIRRASDGARSLDDVMRLLWDRYGRKDVGFPEARSEGIQAAVEQVYGCQPGGLDSLFGAYVGGCEEIDVERHLEAVGLELTEYPGGRIPIRPPPPSEAERRFGMRLHEAVGRVKVVLVRAGSAAYDAGLNAEDDLLAFAGVRASAAGIEAAARALAADEKVEVVAARRDAVVVLGLTAPHPEVGAWRARIAPAAGADAGAAGRRAGWLGGGDEADSVAPKPAGSRTH